MRQPSTPAKSAPSSRPAERRARARSGRCPAGYASSWCTQNRNGSIVGHGLPVRGTVSSTIGHRTRRCQRVRAREYCPIPMTVAPPWLAVGTRRLRLLRPRRGSRRRHRRRRGARPRSGRGGRRARSPEPSSTAPRSATTVITADPRVATCAWLRRAVRGRRRRASPTTSAPRSAPPWAPTPSRSCSPSTSWTCSSAVASRSSDSSARRTARRRHPRRATSGRRSRSSCGSSRSATALDPVTTELVRLRGARAHQCRVCQSRLSLKAVDADRRRGAVRAPTPSSARGPNGSRPRSTSPTSS